MKKIDFSYMRDWLITLAITTLAWDFIGSGFFLVVARFLFKEQADQFLFFGILGMLAFCIALAIKSYTLSLEKNSKRVPVSLAMPIFNLIIAFVIYILIYIISKCNYIAGPVSHAFVTVFWGNGVDMSFVHDITIAQYLSVFIPQALLYVGVSFGAYVLAKYKQDNHNEVLKRLRAEDSQKKEVDPIEAALKNGLGNRK